MVGRVPRMEPWRGVGLCILGERPGFCYRVVVEGNEGRMKGVS